MASQSSHIRQLRFLSIRVAYAHTFTVDYQYRHRHWPQSSQVLQSLVSAEAQTAPKLAVIGDVDDSVIATH